MSTRDDLTPAIAFIEARLDETEARHDWILNEPPHPIPPHDIPHRRGLATVSVLRTVLADAADQVVRTAAADPCPWPEITLAYGGRIYMPGILGDIDITDEYAAWQSSRAEPANPDLIRQLAAIWADHPDYQQEWTP